MTRIILIFISLLLFYSFSLTPMSESIHLDKGQDQVQFQIENQNAEATPVLITLVERYQKIDGSEERPEAKDIEAFPPQMIIPAKERRTIRVKWKGETPKTEKAYRIIAEQLPLNIEGGSSKGTGIKMLLKYEGTLYVNPGKTSPKVVLEKLEVVGKKVVMTFENTGSAHQIIQGPQMLLKNSKGESHKLGKDVFKEVEGQNILAGAKRTIEFPREIIPTKFELSGLQGTITFE